MELDTIFEIYQLIANSNNSLLSRKQTITLRKKAMSSYIQSGFKKVAFDTRRIDQEIEYNPRRGLQNYNRSEAFVSEALQQKIINFAKLRKVLDNLRIEYGREHEWQDSNARVLLSTLNNGLRINQQDGDFAVSQPVQGSLDYIEELLHVRYRLGFDDLTKLAESDLRKVILSKDENLIHKPMRNALEITKDDIKTKGYDSLVEKLLEGCKASAENPDVERTITITIRDKFHKEG